MTGLRRLPIAARRLLLAAAALLSLSAQAAEVRVAVAASFTAPMQKIAPLFEADTGHQAVLAFGSTGRFYSQIVNGAPFDMLLAADDETTARLEQDGLAVRSSSFTYAKGRLVLWSAQPGIVMDRASLLRSGTFEHLAIADPKLAPYGLAAMEVLQAMRIAKVVEPKLVRAENASQAFQFVATGNAQLGFVALSQVMQEGKIVQGSVWLVPGSLYTTIVQNGTILAKGKDNPAAAALAEYLRGEKARAVLRGYGYEF